MSYELQPHCSESAPVQTGGVLWVLPCPMDPAELPAQFTSNFCLSSSFPSSPSGGTGTLKYSPSSWLSSLNLEEDSQGVRAGGGRVPTLLVQETLPQEKVGRIPNLAFPDPLSTELPDTYPSRTGFGVLGSTVGLETDPPAQQERALMPPPICQPTPNLLEADEAGWGILSSWLWQSPTVWGQAEFHREQGPPHETGSILRGHRLALAALSMQPELSQEKGDFNQQLSEIMEVLLRSEAFHTASGEALALSALFPSSRMEQQSAGCYLQRLRLQRMNKAPFA